MNRSKTFLWQILFGLCLISTLGFSCSGNLSRTTTNVVLQVNDHELETKIFAEQLAHKLKHYDSVSLKNPETIKAAKDSLLEEFLHYSLVQDWAEKNDVDVSDADLEAAVKEARGQYPSDLALKQALADEGLSYKGWQEGLRKTVLQKKLFLRLKEKTAEPTPEEMQSYYQMNRDQFLQKAAVRVRQVVLAKQDDAERLLNSMQRNSKLEDLARHFSITPEGSTGGATGWIQKGTLDVFDQVFAWPIGKRSSVLKSPYGFHILEVIEKRPETQLNFDQAKPRILRLMQADREQAAYSAWLEEQIKVARVFKNETLINSVTILTKEEK